MKVENATGSFKEVVSNSTQAATSSVANTLKSIPSYVTELLTTVVNNSTVAELTSMTTAEGSACTDRFGTIMNNGTIVNPISMTNSSVVAGESDYSKPLIIGVVVTVAALLSIAGGFACYLRKRNKSDKLELGGSNDVEMGLITQQDPGQVIVKILM